VAATCSAYGRAMHEISSFKSLAAVLSHGAIVSLTVLLFLSWPVGRDFALRFVGCRDVVSGAGRLGRQRLHGLSAVLHVRKGLSDRLARRYRHRDLRTSFDVPLSGSDDPVSGCKVRRTGPVRGNSDVCRR